MRVAEATLAELSTAPTIMSVRGLTVGYPTPDGWTTPVDGLDSRRTVHLYGVAGRERTAVASAVMRMLRGADWQQVVGKTSNA